MLAIFHSSGRAPWLRDLLKSVHKDVEITGADGRCLSREVSPSLRRCPHATGIYRYIFRWDPVMFRQQMGPLNVSYN
jgi:hypothetical protein